MGSSSLYNLNLIPDDKSLFRRRKLACGCELGDFSAHVKWCDAHWKETRENIMAEPDSPEDERARPEHRGIFAR